MEGRLRAGTILSSDSGAQYKVKKYCAAGAQGEVYQVESGGKIYALKWYYPDGATAQQKRCLKDLIRRGNPDKAFLWPMDMLYLKGSDLFGYVMDFRPDHYTSIIHLMKRKADPTFYVLCKAAYNTAKAFKKLHDEGYSYRDISFGNLFFDPDTGDVLICDNDNVIYNGADYVPVYGTQRFMAPEIVTGKAAPSRHTDQWSLAVLLFYMFMLNHPLDGKREANIRCLDIPAMNMLYGTDPVFIFDPDNDSNRPKRGYQDNALIYWELYPQDLKDLFTQTFTVGIKHPNNRVTENQWLSVLSNMMSCIYSCPKCGAEIFCDPAKKAKNEPHKCWNCRTLSAPPALMKIGKNRLLLVPGRKLYSHHVYSDYDMETEIGEVVQNPKDKRILGVRNGDRVNWTYLRQDGTQTAIAEGKSGAVVQGAAIDFGNVRGEFC